MIFDIFKKRKTVVLGKVHRELRLKRHFGLLRWRWDRVFLKRASLDLENSLNSHIMITGESGAGKSNACKQMLGQLAGMGANFLVLDPHSEYVEHARDIKAEAYDAGIHSVNLFDLDGLKERERTAEITSMFRRIFHLGDVQASTLYRCISYMYWISGVKGAAPSIRSLLYTIKVFKKRARSKPEANILEGLEKRLLVIAGDGFVKNISISKLMNGRSIFSLASLHTAETQAIYMESVLKKIYAAMLSGAAPGKRKFFIVIDEAEKLQDSPVVARLVAEGRKYGIGVIAISQRAKALDKEIRSNAATIIAFAQREPEEQNYISNIIAGGTEYNRFVEIRKALRELGRGRALVQEAKEKNPKIVSCRRFEPQVLDPRHRIMLSAKWVVSKEELFRKLGREGFDRVEIANAISELIRTGFLKYHIVTEEPYRGTWYIAMSKNTAEHDIMVNLISRYLTENGIRNMIYNNSYGPDVIAYMNGKKVAIEYETGLKDADDTEKMLNERVRNYDEIIVLGKLKDGSRFA